jgi:NADH:ubiquinone oxidoreductase subunit F (NADH-binding)
MGGGAYVCGEVKKVLFESIEGHGGNPDLNRHSWSGRDCGGNPLLSTTLRPMQIFRRLWRKGADWFKLETKRRRFLSGKPKFLP